MSTGRCGCGGRQPTVACHDAQRICFTCTSYAVIEYRFLSTCAPPLGPFNSGPTLRPPAGACPRRTSRRCLIWTRSAGACIWGHLQGSSAALPHLASPAAVARGPGRRAAETGAMAAVPGHASIIHEVSAPSSTLPCWTPQDVGRRMVPVPRGSLLHAEGAHRMRFEGGYVAMQQCHMHVAAGSSVAHVD